MEEEEERIAQAEPGQAQRGHLELQLLSKIKLENANSLILAL